MSYNENVKNNSKVKAVAVRNITNAMSFTTQSKSRTKNLSTVTFKASPVVVFTIHLR